MFLFKKNHQHPKRFKRFNARPKPIRLIYLLAVVLILILLFYLFFKALVIKKISINQNIGCVSALDISKTVDLEGKPVISINKEKVVKDLKNKFLCLSKVNIHIKLPNSLVFEFEERKPALVIELTEPEKFDKAVTLSKDQESSPSSRELEATAPAKFIPTLDFDINVATQSGQFVADKEGFIFLKNAEVSNVPKVYGFFEGLHLGSLIDKRIVTGVNELFAKLKETGFEVKESKIIKENYLVFKVERADDDSKIKLVFLLDGDILREAASLQLILQRNRIDLKSIESIDLRFSKPIVVYSNKK